MTPDEELPPAYYALASRSGRRRLREWWLVLHPPYTLWHLSYVTLGACVAPEVDGVRLAATLAAFLLAVGIGAHALDELHDRPLDTTMPGWALASAATVSLTGACALGVVGISRVGAGLVVFIGVGLVLAVGYNLEIAGGRLHNDWVFAAAWGAFPVLTAYYAQAASLDPEAFAAAAAAFALSCAQRRLSAPARLLRRRTSSVEGTVVLRDGSVVDLDERTLLAPLESALGAMSWGMVALATALAIARLT